MCVCSSSVLEAVALRGSGVQYLHANIQYNLGRYNYQFHHKNSLLCLAYDYMN